LKTINLILSAVLLVSAIVSGYILPTDNYLFTVALAHWYVLTAFAVVDLALIVGLWRKPGIAVLGAVLLGVAELTLMVGDVFFGTLTFAPATTPAEFTKYLLGYAPFDTLLGVQVVLIVVAWYAAFETSEKTSAAARMQPTDIAGDHAPGVKTVG
jgi:hypothetical protein